MMKHCNDTLVDIPRKEVSCKHTTGISRCGIYVIEYGLKGINCGEWNEISAEANEKI